MSASMMHRPRRAWLPATGTSAAIIATAVLALLAAACSGSPSSVNAGGSASSRSAVAFARCMRSHGVPDYPDPGSNGQLIKETPQQLGVSSSQVHAATGACGHLLPNTSSGSAQTADRQEWTGMLNFARCMRSHGVPDWPDPTPYPPYPDSPTFNIPASIQPIPQVISKMQECNRLVPNNDVAGHIDTNNWTSVSQAMVGW